MLKYVLYGILGVGIVGAVVYLAINKQVYKTDTETITNGKLLFTKNCSSCHGLQEDGFGPPLGGITNLLSQQTLNDFIRNPSLAIESKEARTMMLYARYKQVMPGFDWLEENEINCILSYIDYQSELHHIKAVATNSDTSISGLTGRLVDPVKRSDIKIELEEVVTIPHIKGTSQDLGIVTLRAHPLGDKTLFVGDQNGIIYRVNNGIATVFLDIRYHIKDFQSGPGIATGIGSFDFHPDFLNNGLIYITHAETFKDQKPDYRISDSIRSEVQWVIAEWKMANVLDTAFSGTHREMLRLHAPTFAHGCQDIGFIPGLEKNHPDYGLLYIGYGDGGSNNIKRPELGHHLRSFLGTIMRIDPAGTNSRHGKYGIPADNPFVKERDALALKEIYAYGFRNPHRIAWDSGNNNRMLVTDIGEANIEELNVVEKGGDYGWPNREGNFGIATTKDIKKVYKLASSDLDLYKNPFVQYDHEDGNAISGGYIYEGDLSPLAGKYICGDIVNGKIFYVNVDPGLSDSTVYELTIMKNGKETSLQELCNTKRLHQRIAYDRFNKELFVITKADGRVWRVTKAY